MNTKKVTTNPSSYFHRWGIPEPNQYHSSSMRSLSSSMAAPASMGSPAPSPRPSSGGATGSAANPLMTPRWEETVPPCWWRSGRRRRSPGVLSQRARRGRGRGEVETLHRRCGWRSPSSRAAWPRVDAPSAPEIQSGSRTVENPGPIQGTAAGRFFFCQDPVN
jgi:hypothetical protein